MDNQVFRFMTRYKGIKGKAWDAVKKWCRTKYKDCYTCKAKNLTTYNAQAGHYQPVAIVGSNNKKAWDHRFIRLQCGQCNGAGQGMQVEFRKRLVIEHGEKVVAEFDRAVLAKEVEPIKDWQMVIDDFQRLTKEAESEV